MEKNPTNPSSKQASKNNEASVSPSRPPKAPGASPFVGMQPSTVGMSTPTSQPPPLKPPPLPSKATTPQTPKITDAPPPYALPSVRQLEPPDIFPAPKQPGPHGSLMPAENIAFFVDNTPQNSEADTQISTEDNIEAHESDLHTHNDPAKADTLDKPEILSEPYSPATPEERKTLAHPMDVFFFVEPFSSEEELHTPNPSTPPLQPPPLKSRPSRHLEEAQTLDVPVIRGVLPSESDLDTGELILDTEELQKPPPNAPLQPPPLGLSIGTRAPSGSFDATNKPLSSDDLALMSTQEVPVIKPPSPRPNHNSLSHSDLELQLEEMGGALGVSLESSGGSLDNLQEALAPTEKFKPIKPPASMRSHSIPPETAMPVLMGTVIEEQLSFPKQIPTARSVTADSLQTNKKRPPQHDLFDDFEDVPTDERAPSHPDLDDDAFLSAPAVLGESLDGSKLQDTHKDTHKDTHNDLYTRKIPTLGSIEHLLEPSAPNHLSPLPTTSKSAPNLPAASKSASNLPAVPTAFLPSRQQCPNHELHIWLFPKLSLDTMSFLYQFAGQCQLMVQKAIPSRPPRQANLGCLYTDEETCLQWSGDPLLLQIILPPILESFGQLQPPQLKTIAEKLQLKEPLQQQSNALQVARQILIGTRPFAHALRDGISQLGQSQISLLHSALHGSTEVLFESQNRTPTPDPLREQRLMLSYQIQVNIPIQVLERRLEESFSLSLYQIVPKRLPLELIYLGIVHHFDLRNQLQELISMLRDVSPKLDLAPFHTYSAMRTQQRRK